MPEKSEGGSPGVTVMRGVPDMRIRVGEDVTLCHEGDEYVGGDELTVDGPLALALQAQGQATIIEEV